VAKGSDQIWRAGADILVGSALQVLYFSTLKNSDFELQIPRTWSRLFVTGRSNQSKRENKTSRKEHAKKFADKRESKKLAPKASTASKKQSGELDDEQLERIAGGVSYIYHGET